MLECSRASDSVLWKKKKSKLKLFGLKMSKKLVQSKKKLSFLKVEFSFLGNAQFVFMEEAVTTRSFSYYSGGFLNVTTE